MTTHSLARIATPLLSGLWARLVTIAEVLAEASHGMRCAREAERLSQLSDAELAKRGITRDGIIQHAFRGYI